MQLLNIQSVAIKECKKPINSIVRTICLRFEKSYVILTGYHRVIELISKL